MFLKGSEFQALPKVMIALNKAKAYPESNNPIIYSQAWEDVSRVLHQLVEIRIAPAAFALLLEEGLQVPQLIKRLHV